MASDRQLLAILAGISAGAATMPALQELPVLVQLFLLTGFATGMLADWRNWRIPTPALTVVALTGTFFALARFSWSSPVTSFLSIAVILLAIRLMTEKNRRNYLQLFSLAVFILAASSLIRLDAFYFVALLMLSTSGMVALVILTARELPTPKVCPPAVTGRLIAVGLLLTVCAVPLAAAFFLILPRTQLPLWRFMPESGSSSGFAEQVQPGKNSSQQTSGRVAFRAEIAMALPQDRLYWRATVLNHFDGTTWRRTQADRPAELPRGMGREEIQQTIYLEPGLGRYLVGLDIPTQISGLRFSLAPDAVITSGAAGSSRLRYQVTSHPRLELVLRSAAEPAGYLDLPPDTAPRLVQLGLELRQRHATPAERLQQVEALFVRQGLRYATSGMATSPTPIDDFFFNLRQGNCEFFASAGAILLRAAGIPARLVGGYYGGEYQELGGFYTVTDERAHVWIEALVAEHWQRIDPSRWAVNGAEVGQSARRQSLARRLMTYVDLIDHYWTRSVVTFDLQRQMAAADKAGATLARLLQPGNLRRYLPWLAGLGAVGISAIFVRRVRIPSREERLLRVFQRQLGRTLPPATCLLDLARSVADRRLRRALTHYAGTIYRGRRISATGYRRLRKLLGS